MRKSRRIVQLIQTYLVFIRAKFICNTGNIQLFAAKKLLKPTLTVWYIPFKPDFTSFFSFYRFQQQPTHPTRIQDQLVERWNIFSDGNEQILFVFLVFYQLEINENIYKKAFISNLQFFQMINQPFGCTLFFFCLIHSVTKVHISILLLILVVCYQHVLLLVLLHLIHWQPGIKIYRYHNYCCMQVL